MTKDNTNEGRERTACTLQANIHLTSVALYCTAYVWRRVFRQVLGATTKMNIGTGTDATARPPDREQRVHPVKIDSTPFVGKGPING